MSWAAQPLWPAGHKVTAAEAAEVLARLKALSNNGNINNVGAADTTTSSSYANLAATSSFSFVKLQDATNVRVDFHATCYPNGATNTAAQFAVLIGGTDYDIAYLFINTASEHNQVSGVRVIPGLAAGAYTVQGRWKRPTGAATLTRDSGDWLSICAQEVG